MRLTVVTDKACTINSEHKLLILQCAVMHYLIIATL